MIGNHYVRFFARKHMGSRDKTKLSCDRVHKNMTIKKHLQLQRGRPVGGNICKQGDETYFRKEIFSSCLSDLCISD